MLSPIFAVKLITMAYTYTKELIDTALSYADYRNHIKETLALPPADATAERMRPHLASNSALMDQYDRDYRVGAELLNALSAAPAVTWLVISEGWCGDAAFNVPLLHVAERALPEKVCLRLVLRDSNPELMDANLTDGGRSIPKLIVLGHDLEPLGYWGPRPAGLQTLMKQWKNEGLELKELIPKVHHWYDIDKTRSVQRELTRLVTRYS